MKRAHRERSAARKVLLIGIDGCRPDAMLWADTPHIDGLLQRGAYSFHAKCSPISLSGPGWATILTGCHPARHRVMDNATADGCLGVSNLFQLAKHCDPKIGTSLTSAIAGTPPWLGIEHMGQPQCDRYRAFHEADEATNLRAATADLCARLELAECHELNMLYTHHVDSTGHRVGFAPHVPEYRAAIELVDSCVGLALSAIEQRERLFKEDWLVCITTDHGGSARSCMPVEMQQRFDGESSMHRGVSQTTLEGVHGLDTPQHRGIFLILGCAKGIQAGEILPSPSQADVVPTLLRHLNCSRDQIDRLELDGQPRAVQGRALEADSVQDGCLCCPTKICFKTQKISSKRPKLTFDDFGGGIAPLIIRVK